MSDNHPVYRTRCLRCPFGPDPIFDGEKRLRLFKSLAESNAFFQCHRALARHTTIVCRGYYDSSVNEQAKAYQADPYTRWREQPPFDARLDVWDTEEYPANLVGFETEDTK